MNRRITRNLLAAVMIAASFAPAAAQTTLKVSSFLPPNNAWQKALESWGKELEEKSDGDLKLEIYPAAQLGPPNRQYQLVTSGVADISVVLHSATPGRFPVTELAGLPLTYPASGKTSAIMSRRLTELAPEFLAKEHRDTKILWMAVTSPLKLHTTKTTITSPGDIKGLRVRYAGKVFQQMLDAFGASPMSVSPAETVDALSKGVIDGAMFPYEATKSFNLGPVVKHSLEPGFATNTFALVMNQSVFDGLSEQDQKIIDETTGADRAEAFGKMWDADEEAGRQYMLDNKVEIQTLSDDQLAPFKALAEPIVKQAVSAVDGAGKPGSAFLEAYTK
ncbi:TRAP transporter substrate-binding protein [Rhizobium halophytocola]|uniref:TRAP-type C4-dicarboxylate transport system substrate-binding protein n=1 Tax=Rhizobium halophytocola TaxID=735519 RepID=A0ABS4DUE1_9HYPH|nr:TRAP transporter substrate-binding protein [Rhizobium halophytocola]MBP1849277.1 TRAP-type C4-dicarboxylate transport system substrate-binding protein [Rhizobium halophytocola]